MIALEVLLVIVEVHGYHCQLSVGQVAMNIWIRDRPVPWAPGEQPLMEQVLVELLTTQGEPHLRRKNHSSCRPSACCLAGLAA
mmetsp:Transcript_75098/g.244149  ORF Transcript_75098/g.244149 Transcript_75098/m.244149 type:complete len:83 (-) Transcript_75098:37-285(-)